MTRYLWHLDAGGWPLERIDTVTGQYVPVCTGGTEESLDPQDGGRSLACCYPRVGGVVWSFGGDGHPRGYGCGVCSRWELLLRGGAPPQRLWMDPVQKNKTTSGEQTHELRGGRSRSRQQAQQGRGSGGFGDRRGGAADPVTPFGITRVRRTIYLGALSKAGEGPDAPG